MTPKCYATGHQHSNVIMAAFSEGCKGQVVPPLKLLEGPAAMYGILRGTDDILRQCEWIERDYYYLDHGYFRPGHYEGYYRVTKNARQAYIDREYPPDRFDKLDVSLRKWKRSGKGVMVTPLTGAVGAFYGIDPKKWLETVTNEISLHTDKPIVVKAKRDGDIESALLDVWCLVTHSSNAAVDALRLGVPVITLGESACESVSWGFDNIESPVWPERENWAFGLAYHQFTLDEMRSGVCWEILNE